MDSVEGVSLSMDSLSIQCNCLSEDFLFKEVLPKLPVKSLMRFKCVSKGWSAHISRDRSFIADHYFHHHSDTQNHSFIARAAPCDDRDRIAGLFQIGHGGSSPLEIDTSYIAKALIEQLEEARCHHHLIGSCNGVVLIKQVYNYGNDDDDDGDNDEDGDHHHNYQCQLVVWNPATREFRSLPEPIAPTLMPGMCPYCGFDEHSIGISKDCNDYKIVRIAEFHRIYETGVRFTLDVQLFTKSSGRWSRLKVLSGCELLGNLEGGAVIDGFIYWALKHRESGGHFSILTFDLESEELKEIDGPASQSGGDYAHLELIKWMGSLGALMTKLLGRERHFWLKSNNSLCWTKMFIIKPPVSSWPFLGVLRDEFLLYNDGDNVDILYDPVTEKKRHFVKEFGRIIPHNFQHYAPSLISPN